MSKSLYSAPVPVGRERHANLWVDIGTYGFARGMHAAPLLAVEIEAAAADYPVVFTDDEAAMPVALLGVQEGENLHVDDGGHWTGGHVPAYLQRYPFMLVKHPERTGQVLIIDEDAKMLNHDGHGERLFDTTGSPTAFLNRTLRLLEEYEHRRAVTRTFAAALTKYNLLQPVSARFHTAKAGDRVLGGFRIIDRDRLRTLPDDAIIGFFRKSELACIYAHLASLRHFPDLADLTRPRDPSAGADGAL